MTEVVTDDTPPVEAVRYYLDVLAKMTPDAIAGWLMEGEYQGYRGDCGQCALALFLAMASDADEVVIEYDGMGGTATVYTPDATTQELPLPVSPLIFARRFDAGAFPALEVGAL